MAIIKVIEVIASSEKSFDDATRKAVEEAGKTVKNIKSVNVKNMNARVQDGKIVSFAINAKVSFEINK